MIFSGFCKLTLPKYFGYSSQASYMKGLFKSANILRDYSDDYLKALYASDEPLSPNVKKQFPKPVDEESVAAFYIKNIKAEYLDEVCDAFGIPVDLERDAGYLAKALAKQFSEFINSKEGDLENIVPAEYTKARIQNETCDYDFRSVLYKGDSAWAEEQNKKHSVGCYEHFQHIWVIHNMGNVQWFNRKLVCVNPGKISPVISDSELLLPDVSPNGYIKIATDIDARGCEGHFISKWDMQDISGNNCFPRSRSLFDISIDVTFDPENAEV